MERGVRPRPWPDAVPACAEANPKPSIRSATRQPLTMDPPRSVGGQPRTEDDAVSGACGRVLDCGTFG
jgi:hypothetical protein